MAICGYAMDFDVGWDEDNGCYYYNDSFYYDEESEWWYNYYDDEPFYGEIEHTEDANVDDETYYGKGKGRGRGKGKGKSGKGD